MLVIDEEVEDTAETKIKYHQNRAMRVGKHHGVNIDGNVYHPNALLSRSLVQSWGKREFRWHLDRKRIIPVNQDGSEEIIAHDPMPGLPAPDDPGGSEMGVGRSRASQGGSVDPAIKLIEPAEHKPPDDTHSHATAGPPRNPEAAISEGPLSSFNMDPEALAGKELSTLQTLFAETATEEQYYDCDDKDEIIAVLSQDFAGKG